LGGHPSENPPLKRHLYTHCDARAAVWHFIVNCTNQAGSAGFAESGSQQNGVNEMRMNDVRRPSAHHISQALQTRQISEMAKPYIHHVNPSGTHFPLQVTWKSQIHHAHLVVLVMHFLRLKLNQFLGSAQIKVINEDHNPELSERIRCCG
jgi:hypothetical protein